MGQIVRAWYVTNTTDFRPTFETLMLRFKLKGPVDRALDPSATAHVSDEPEVAELPAAIQAGQHQWPRALVELWRRMQVMAKQLERQPGKDPNGLWEDLLVASGLIGAEDSTAIV